MSREPTRRDREKAREIRCEAADPKRWRRLTESQKAIWRANATAHPTEARFVEHLAAAIAEARREGAEKMRERAAAVAETNAEKALNGLMDRRLPRIGSLHIGRDIADDIRALPLEEKP